MAIFHSSVNIYHGVYPKWSKTLSFARLVGLVLIHTLIRGACSANDFQTFPGISGVAMVRQSLR